MSEQQREQRRRRDLACERLWKAKAIEAEVAAYSNYDNSRFRKPRSWEWLQPWEQRLLGELQNGNLQRECDAARAAHGGPVTAGILRTPQEFTED